MDLSLYMTVAEAAAELKLSKSRVGQFITAGKLPAVRMGNLRLVLKSDVKVLKPQVRGVAGRPAKSSPARKSRKESTR